MKLTTLTLLMVELTATPGDLPGSVRAKFSFLQGSFPPVGFRCCSGTGCSPRRQHFAELALSSSAGLFVLGSRWLASIGVLGIALAGAEIVACMVFRTASLIRRYLSNIEN